jgi:putative endonuclease
VQYTARRRPVELVYSETFESLASAIGREKQLKRWSSQKKEALITGDVAALKQLSKRRKK